MSRLPLAPVLIGCVRGVGLWRPCRRRTVAARRALRVVRAAAPWKRPAQEVLDEVGRSSVVAVLEFDEHAHPLAEHRVGHRHGRGHRDGGMGRHDLLDRDGADVLAAAEDEVRRAAGQAEVAVGVQLTDVAHPHPAVLGEQLVVVGATQVAEAGRRAAANRLSATGFRDVASPSNNRTCISGTIRPAVRSRRCSGSFDGGRTEHAGLVGAVELQNRDSGQLLELRGLRVRERLAAGEDDAQAGEVALPGRGARPGSSSTAY